MNTVNGSNDILLIQELKEGSETAFSTLFEKYNGWLFKAALAKCGNEQVAADIMQEIFVKVWEVRATLDPEKPLYNFLWICMRNKFINYIKEQKRLQNYQEQALKIPANTSTPPPQIEPDDQDKLINQLLTAIDKLPIQHAKRALTMVYVDGKKPKNAAKELNIKERTFRNSLHHGLVLLRKMVKIPV